MTITQPLIDAALQLAAQRWPNREAGAAALLTATGRILTSTYAESPNPAACLCHETGAICEAHKLNEAVTASVYVSREDANAPFIILPPCGICCERLAFWGGEVEIAIPDSKNPTQWKMQTLREIMPHYWQKPWPQAPQPPKT